MRIACLLASIRFMVHSWRIRTISGPEDKLPVHNRSGKDFRKNAKFSYSLIVDLHVYAFFVAFFVYLNLFLPLEVWPKIYETWCFCSATHTCNIHTCSK